MVVGSKISLKLTVKDSSGNPISEGIVSGMTVKLLSTADHEVVKTLSVDNGIEKIGNEYTVTLTETDTILLSGKGGKALLQGFLTPCRRAVTIDLGIIKENAAND